MLGKSGKPSNLSPIRTSFPDISLRILEDPKQASGSGKCAGPSATGTLWWFLLTFDRVRFRPVIPDLSIPENTPRPNDIKEQYRLRLEREHYG